MAPVQLSGLISCHPLDSLATRGYSPFHEHSSSPASAQFLHPGTFFSLPLLIKSYSSLKTWSKCQPLSHFPWVPLGILCSHNTLYMPLSSPMCIVLEVSVTLPVFSPPATILYYSYLMLKAQYNAGQKKWFNTNMMNKWISHWYCPIDTCNLSTDVYNNN